MDFLLCDNCSQKNGASCKKWGGYIPKEVLLGLPRSFDGETTETKHVDSNGKCIGYTPELEQQENQNG